LLNALAERGVVVLAHGCKVLEIGHCGNFLACLHEQLDSENGLFSVDDNLLYNEAEIVVGVLESSVDLCLFIVHGVAEAEVL